MAGLAVYIPENRCVGSGGKVFYADGFQALENLFRGGACRAYAREVPLDVGHEGWNSDGGKGFGHLLQSDRLSGAGGAGDESVTIGHTRQQRDLFPLGHCNDQR